MLQLPKVTPQRVAVPGHLRPSLPTSKRAVGGDSLVLGDVSISLETDGDLLRGFGRVAVRQTPLRNVARPWFVDIRTPGGMRLTDFRLVAQTRTHAGFDLQLEPSGVADAGSVAEWMNHEARPRVVTSDWTAKPRALTDTRLTISLAACQRTLGEWKATGFSYQFSYLSPSHPIYRILDRGTWEPGGHAVGCELWMRGCGTPIVRLDNIHQHHSTEWYLPTATNPNVYQFFPLQTHLQGFTFTANSHGVLVTWANRPAHVRTMLEKPRGLDQVEHWHEHCGDLSSEFVTAPIEVLFIPGDFDRVDLMNIYEAVRTHVWSALHQQAGIKPERVTTYGYIEQWDRPDLDRYRVLGLPKLLDAGVRRIGLANHFQNNMNVLGVSNMCCTLDLKVAESVGSERLKALCDTAAESGAEVEMWGNTALSALGLLLHKANSSASSPAPLVPASAMEAYELLAKAEDPYVHNPNGAIDADHYAPSFAVLNLRDATVRRWWMDRWRDAHDQIGLCGIFLDSSFNLSSDKFHWRAIHRTKSTGGATIDQHGVLEHSRPAQEPSAMIQSQYLAHLELVGQMQTMGYHYSGEDAGVFGVSRCGATTSTRPETFFLWMDCITQFDVPAVRKRGLEPDDVFFRGLAYRMMWMINWDPHRDRLSFCQSGWRGEFDSPGEWHQRLLQAYNRVEAHMLKRSVMPDERGLEYEGEDGTRVLWMFQDGDVQLPTSMAAIDVLEGSTQRGPTLAAEARHVYLVTLTG